MYYSSYSCFLNSETERSMPPHGFPLRSEAGATCVRVSVDLDLTTLKHSAK